MKKVIFLLLFQPFLWLFACSKNVDPRPEPKDSCPWPEITTEGLNTFGCKINDKKWVPCVDLNGAFAGIRPIDCLLNESDGSNAFSISLSRSVYDPAYSDTTFNALLTVWLKPGFIGQQEVPGIFDISRFGWYPNGISDGYEKIDPAAQNYFRVDQIDTSNNIISGQFQITLIREKTGDKVKITDGRFDIKYYPQ